MKDQKVKIKSYNKRELIALYGCTYQTLKNWIVKKGKLFDEEYYNKTSLFNPKEVESIFNHLGLPDID